MTRDRKNFVKSLGNKIDIGKRGKPSVAGRKFMRQIFFADEDLLNHNQSRPLKPVNIFITEDLTPKISLKFGISENPPRNVNSYLIGLAKIPNPNHIQPYDGNYTSDLLRITRNSYQHQNRDNITILIGVDPSDFDRFFGEQSGE
ncbi:hypothetical protein TSUD_67890 [Trifolium subterraneum]|uniref:KEN domain-containing protein n=1 Tax=Trifolium subterraneum TaxID=3900 RepID=A0A2Z6NKF1_TRISU|nr:hypothetical protein TSUD_67890 [Trifolium subterraneum]